mgnify:CR=1 FL=1|tara:strand:- start:1432 stop:2103 length:672 start_codon:yes stop_codon:yes gene_type:complete
MANFQTQIENIAGETSTSTQSDLTDYQNMLNDFLKQSARALLDTLPNDVLERDAVQKEVANDSGFDVTDVKLIKVNRNGYGCIQVPLEFKARMEPDSKSIYEPTKKSPIYYIEGQSSSGAKLFVKPAPTNSEKATIDVNQYPAPLYTDSAITNFPDRAEYSVVIGAALRLLQHKINKLVHSDEDVELAQVAQQDLAMVKGMYTEELMRLGVPVATGGQADGAE